MKTNLFASTSLVIALVAASGTPAYAQNAPASAPAAAPMSDDIIVTARKREENVQNVPVSVTAFSAATLEKAGLKGFEGIATSNPNVKIQVVAGSGLARSVSIRGNVQSSSTIAVDPSVGTYVDGHLVAHTFGVAGLTVDVASIQTLKGPQGTLFGRNTTGGAILITTVDPKIGELGGLVQGDIGGVGTQRLGGAINIPLANFAALRLVYQHNSLGDYETFSNGKSFGRKTEEVLRAKLLLKPTEDLSILISAEKANESQHATLAIPTFPNAPVYKNIPITSYASPDPRAPGTSPVDARSGDEGASSRSESYAITIAQQVGSGTIKLIAGRHAYSLGIAQSLPPSLGYTFQDKPGNHDTSAELQYTGTLVNDHVDLAAGLFYFEESIHERQNTFLYSGAQRTSRSLDETSKSKSAYAQATAHLTDKFNITGGLRYTSDDKSGLLYSATLGVNANGTTALAATLPSASLAQSSNKLNYLISADYSPIEHVMLYLSHASGYRAGGAGVDRVTDTAAAASANSTAFQTIQGFLPESVKNYEVGFKTQFFDRALTLNGAAFLQNYANYQYTAINPATITRVTLNADAQIKGFELDGKLHLGTGTTLSANVGMVDGKVKSGPSTGSSLSYVPKWTYGVALAQNFNLANGDLDLVATYSWRGKFWSNLNDPNAAGDEVATSTVDSLGLLNLSATYTKGAYTLAVYADNVTDKKYFTYITYAGSGAIAFGALGTPRVIGVRGKFAF